MTTSDKLNGLCKQDKANIQWLFDRGYFDEKTYANLIKEVENKAIGMDT